MKKIKNAHVIDGSAPIGEEETTANAGNQKSPKTAQISDNVAEKVDQLIRDDHRRIEAILATSENLSNKIEVNGERWFTYQQMCAILKCHRSTVFNFVKKGKIEVLEVDSTTLYRLHKDYM